MAASSSSSASAPLANSSSPAVAQWLLLLPRPGHLKFLREKEKEDSWGLLAMMVLMFSCRAAVPESEGRESVVFRVIRECRELGLCILRGRLVSRTHQTEQSRQGRGEEKRRV
uniref:Uncharacterized protein n=1 Tax=Arundo donax TaxID=35708 RepID=A0A0A8Y466_ARUDO